MVRDPARGPGARAGFTVFEVAVVTLIVGILLTAAIPATARIGQTHAAAASAEVARQLRLARSTAAAAGHPVGLTIDPADDTLSLVELPLGSASPTPAADPLGTPRRTVSLRSLYPSADITGVTHGDGSTGAGTVWLGHDGRPQVRDAGGAYESHFTQDASVTLADAATVVVRRHSGLVE